MNEGLIDLLISLAPRISEMLVSSYWKTKKVATNESQDIVTKADHEIGQYIAGQVLRKFPEVEIDSEETEEKYGKNKTVVRLDPIDGTKHFVNGIDLFASAISVNHDSETYFGLVINPFSKKNYYAIKEEGAFLNGRRITVNNLGIEKSFIVHEQPTSKFYGEDPELFKQYTEYLTRLMEKGFRLRNIGLGSLSGCWVAEGAACAYVNFTETSKLYDVEASLFIAQQAGAVMGDFYGKKYNRFLYNKKQEKKELSIGGFIIANPIAYQEIVNLFQG